LGHLARLGLRRLSELVHARGESFQESRTREIRISGSTRGEWVALFAPPSLLLYRLSNVSILLSRAREKRSFSWDGDLHHGLLDTHFSRAIRIPFKLGSSAAR
jgi:hypothetical protein